MQQWEKTTLFLGDSLERYQNSEKLQLLCDSGNDPRELSECLLDTVAAMPTWEIARNKFVPGASRMESIRIRWASGVSWQSLKPSADPLTSRIWAATRKIGFTFSMFFEIWNYDAIHLCFERFDFRLRWPVHPFHTGWSTSGSRFFSRDEISTVWETAHAFLTRLCITHQVDLSWNFQPNRDIRFVPIGIELLRCQEVICAISNESW